MSTYFQHGRRHAPGGTDPIPGNSLSHVREYRAYGTDLVDLVQDGIWSGASNWDFVTVESTVPGSTTTVASSAAPLGGYLELVGQNSYVCLGFPLGPRYSAWSFKPIFGMDTDGGIVTVEWQTQGSMFNNAPQWGYGPDNLGSDTNWYHSTVTDNEYYEVNTYSASTDILYATEACPNLYIVGEDGKLVTDNPDTITPFYTDTVEWDGGGDGTVWWWVRMKTKTKDGASSGYTLRLHGYVLRRIAGDLIAPG